jgi:D-glucosaminate-6-phosphate ammonia-lyase
MNVYESLGVRTLINARGEATRFGGALMEQETIDAMSEAAKYSVRIEELQAAASKIISRITGAEAGYVTCGASAATTLATAACLAGFDIDRMNRLPDTSNIPNEVLMDYRHRQGYDHAIRAAGAKIINVGMPNARVMADEIHATKWWEFDSAITERTVAIAYYYVPQMDPLHEVISLEEVIKISHKRNIPLIVDAAEQVPPVENLRKFIAMGATMVVYSGGKGIRGPQNSGILCGPRDLIASAALQNMDTAMIDFETWDPPPSFIPKEKLRGVPQQGVGRGMKVSKESIVGLLVALQRMTDEKSINDIKQLRRRLERISELVRSVSGVDTDINELVPGGNPLLMVRLNQVKLGRSAAEVAKRLRDSEPRVFVVDELSSIDMLVIPSINLLNDEQANTVGQQLLVALKS